MKPNKLSVVSFILSVLPLLTLIPVVLQLSLLANVNSILTMVNGISIVSAFVLAITQIRNKQKRNSLSIVAFIVSGGLMLVMVGIVAFALIYNVML